MFNPSSLFDDLMNLCESTDSFYFVDHEFVGNYYRVFTYRLASFTDFQRKNAVECRGHTFKRTDNGWELVSLPMQKFWNYHEHIGWGENIDLSGNIMIMDKLDGSLISTVYHDGDNIRWKSKTSFTSQQAMEAADWFEEYSDRKLFDAVHELVNDGKYTVNFEYTGPNNLIVLNYSEPKLTVLNVRSMEDGSYLSHDDLIHYFGENNVVNTLPVPNDPYRFIEETIESDSNIEGFVIVNTLGQWVKLKTNKYIGLHKISSAIAFPRNLFETCVNGLADDARAMFVGTPHYQRIVDMEEKVSTIYNRIHKAVYGFYEENKHLDRKTYAIVGQEALNPLGVFGLAMNLYCGKKCDIKAFMIKHYKDYGISDEQESVE